MIEDGIEERLGWTAARVDAELRELELAHRELEARRIVVLAAAESLQVADVDGHRSLKAYVRATINQSSVTAHAHIRRARFCRAYPRAGDALCAGHVGVDQVDELARVAGHPRVGCLFSDELVAVFVAEAEHCSFDEFKRLLDQWVLLADHDGAAQDARDDIERRNVSVHVVGGLLSVNVEGGDPLTAERIRLIWDRMTEREYREDVEARRARYGDDAENHSLPRTAAQRRFDAFVAIFDIANAHADAPGKPVDVTVNVLIDERTLHDAFAQAEVMLPGGESFDPADLAGLAEQQREALLVELLDPQAMRNRRCTTGSGQPVHPQLVARALLGGHIRKVVLNSVGEVVEIGSRRRLFTGAWAVAAHLARPTCEHPGCGLAGHLCQIDHRAPHHHGGPTAQPNSAIECGYHNRLKHIRRWQTVRATNQRLLTVRADGTLMLPVGERPPDVAAPRKVPGHAA